MNDFDFGECLNEVDVDVIEKNVSKYTQSQMEKILCICEGQLKYPDDLYDYEIEEAKLYIKIINEKMLEIPSNDLVVLNSN